MKLLKTFKGLKEGDILTVRPDAKEFPKVKWEFEITGRMFKYKTITVPEHCEHNRIRAHGWNWSPEMFIDTKNIIWI